MTDLEQKRGGGQRSGQRKVAGGADPAHPANPPPFPPLFFDEVGGTPTEQANKFSGPQVRTGFKLMLSAADIAEVQLLTDLQIHHEKLVKLIGAIYAGMAYEEITNASILEMILEATATNERLRDRLIAIDVRNGGLD